MPEALARCFEPATLGHLTLRNRLIKSATFEGRTPGGVITPALERFHERIGQGGIAMTTLAYCAAEPNGRMHENMLCMESSLEDPLRRFIARVHATGARVSGQLGHAGGFTKNREFDGRRPLGPSFGLNPLGIGYGMPFVGAMTQRQIRERTATMAKSASFMQSVGFDAIEIHFGHGYGISQFISPKTNRRTDAYGGCLVNRMRFAMETLAAIRTAVGDGYPLLGKISMSDGVRGGIDLSESPEIAAMLSQNGLDVIVCSAGSSSHNPMMIFRGESLAPGLIEHEEKWLVRTSLRLAKGSFFRRYPYEETYLLDDARRIQERASCAVCYIGGVSTARSIARVMEFGFDFIQLGRALLFDPDLPKNVQSHPDYENGCTHCNRCATLIEAPGGVQCVDRPANFTQSELTPGGALATPP